MKERLHNVWIQVQSADVSVFIQAVKQQLLSAVDYYLEQIHKETARLKKHSCDEGFFFLGVLIHSDLWMRPYKKRS